MNKERLEELQARAKDATEVAATLEKLSAADPYRRGVQCSLKELNTGDALLDNSLLKKVIATGRLSVIAEYERRLQKLLGIATADEADEIAGEILAEAEGTETPVLGCLQNPGSGAMVVGQFDS